MSEMDKKTVTLLITSDIHGYIYPTNYKKQNVSPLGLSRLATLVKEKRLKEKNVLLIDNGDAIQGSPFTYYHRNFQNEKPNPVIQAMNYMKYDAAAIGNHEFSYGLEYFLKAAKQSDFPWLSANIVEEDKEASSLSKPYTIKIIDGIRIAILGVTTHFVSFWENEEHLAGLQVKDAAESTKKWVERIRAEEAPDILIAAYHGGIERDLDTGIVTEPGTGENQAYQICREVDGIDVLITGHQHREVHANVNGVVVIQPGSFGQSLGEIEIKLGKKAGHWSIEEKIPNIRRIREEDEPDAGLLQLLEETEEQVQNWLDEPIGKGAAELKITEPFQVRFKEHPFIELVNKVQMQATGARISCTALFDENSPGLSGEITIRDVLANYTYPNTLRVKRLTGYDIKQALEKSATYFHVDENNKVDVSMDYIEPKERHYLYDMWEGINYRIELSKPVGSRITWLEHQGRPIIYDQHYDVVMNNYRAGGGGEYKMFTDRPVVYSVQTGMVELLIDYIREHSPLKAECNHNWQITV